MTFRGGFMGRLQGGQQAQLRLRDLNRSVFQVITRHLAPYRGKLILAVLATLVVSATALLMPYLSKVAIDTFIAQRDTRGLTIIAITYLAVNALNWLGQRQQGYLAAWIGQHLIHGIRGELFEQVLRQSQSFHERERVGQISSRLTNDVNALSEMVSTGMLNLLVDALTLIGIVVVMLLMSWRLALVTFIAIPIVLIAMSFLGRQMRKAYREVQNALAQVNTGVEQGVAGMKVTQSLSRESFTVEQFQELSQRNMKANLRASLLFASVFPMMTITNTLGTVLVLGYGSVLVANGQITVGVLVAFLAYVWRFFGPLRELSLIYNTIQSAAASLERVSEYLDHAPEVPEPDYSLAPEAGFQGGVSLQDVTFGYGAEPVLRNVDLEIAPGETIAVVGPTGAGKTTIASLVTRLYDPQSGAVLIDGIDARQIGKSDLRGLALLVPQNVFLFADTIGENIRYGRIGAESDDIVDAARRAQAHSFISELPEGYDTPVGEVGGMLSGGQRQLVALSRALVADPKVLILDEATANVDAHTEAMIQQAMREIARDRTLIIIAHRFSTLRLADRIVVVDEGRIVGEGTHEALLVENEVYQRLYHRQWADSAD